MGARIVPVGGRVGDTLAGACNPKSARASVCNWRQRRQQLRHVSYLVAAEVRAGLAEFERQAGGINLGPLVLLARRRRLADGRQSFACSAQGWRCVI
mgnify:CR=1 FL=1